MTSFYFPDGDLTIKASDNIKLRVHKSKMASASTVFADMFSFPAPEKDEGDELERVDASVELTESSRTLDDLLMFIYHDKSTSSVLLDKNTSFTSPLEDYERYSSLFEAACKYEVALAQEAAVDALHSLLPHRALRAQIEDLATRLDHPSLAAHAKHYESIKLNKQLRAAAAWRTSSRKYMWQFWALCWVLAVVAIIKLAVSLHIHISLNRFVFPACDTGVACPHQVNIEFKLSVFTAFVSLFLAPVYCCFLVASQPVDRSILRFLIVVTWFLWVVDCIYSTLHLRASHGNCDRVSPNNPEFFADCLLRMASMSSVGLSYFCLLLSSPSFISVGYWLSAVIYQQWLIVASIPRQTVPLNTLPELKPHSL